MGAASLVAVALACSPHSSAPTSPSSTVSSSGNAEEGVTLKATAPVPQSPINDAKIADGAPTLTATAATGKFATLPLQYRFQALRDTGTLVRDSGLVASRSFTVTAAARSAIR